jgi:hypothetical protein
VTVKEEVMKAAVDGLMIVAAITYISLDISTS